MKYMLETTEDGCIEILELHDGSKYIKNHIKKPYGSQCQNKDLWEQMEEDGICEEITEKVWDCLDGFLPMNFMDIAELDN